MQTTPTQPLTSAWRLQDAKSQFSTLVEQALRGVPQHVTRRGKQAVVVLSEQDFAALQRGVADSTGKPASLISHLLTMPKMPADDENEWSDANGIGLQPRDLDFS